MTRMIPATPARSVTRSEREVFESIREAKGSDEFYCLHSVGLARHLRKSYGEADFIVIGPPGVFCLEVKGGQIKRNEGIWTIGWPRGSYESMEGPFKQSQQTIYPLEPVRRLYVGLQSFRSMSRMDASLMKASALRLRFSQSLASRRQRLSQAMVRSTTQRLGWTTKPFTRSDRLTISVSRSGRMPARAR